MVQLVEYQTRNQEGAGSTHTRSTASNLEQVANLLCAQANSASYPQRDGKRLRLRGEGLVWVIGAMVCLLAALWVQLYVIASALFAGTSGDIFGCECRLEVLTQSVRQN